MEWRNSFKVLVGPSGKKSDTELKLGVNSYFYGKWSQLIIYQSRGFVKEFESLVKRTCAF